MKCKNCGQIINGDEKFCTNCGTQLDQKISNDEELVNAFIGTNNDKLKTPGFSVNTLFFGPYYLLYRKMYFLGGMIIVLNAILTYFIPAIALILLIVINLILAFKFKTIYLSHVKNKVINIKIQNQEKNSEELKKICEKNGGTTIFGTIIPIIFSIVYTILIVMISLDTISPSMDYKVNDELSYKLSSKFEESQYNSNGFKSYGLETDTDKCNINITSSSIALLTYYNDVEGYLDNRIYRGDNDIYSGITTKEINEKTWYTASVEMSYATNYYYAIFGEERAYSIEFKLYKDSGICSKEYNDFIKSLKLK